jgi:hypothetical protein
VHIKGYILLVHKGSPFRCKLFSLTNLNLSPFRAPFHNALKRFAFPSSSVVTGLKPGVNENALREAPASAKLALRPVLVYEDCRNLFRDLISCSHFLYNDLQIG